MTDASSADPILRVRMESGDSHDDPSEDLLFMLLEDIEDGDGTFLIIERLTDETGQTYAQTRRRDDGLYDVEHRDGAPDRHFATVAAGAREAHAILTAWAFELPAPDSSLEWTRISFE